MNYLLIKHIRALDNASQLVVCELSYIHHDKYKGLWAELNND